MENRPLVQSQCCCGNYLLRVSWSSITFCGPLKSTEEITFLLKQYMTSTQLGWDSAAGYSEPSDPFHTNYKSICIIYGLPITVKVTDLALNVLRSLIPFISYALHFLRQSLKRVDGTFGKSRSLTRFWSRSRSRSRTSVEMEKVQGVALGSKDLLAVFSRQRVSLTLFTSPTSADNSLVTTSGQRKVAEESNQNQKKANPQTPAPPTPPSPKSTRKSPRSTSKLNVSDRPHTAD